VFNPQLYKFLSIIYLLTFNKLKKMKKIYLILLSVLLMSSAAIAQNVTLWQEQFTDQDAFDQWTTFSTGTNPWAWDGGTTPTAGGPTDNGKALVASAVNNNAWLVSPGKQLKGGVTYTLRFWKRLSSVNANGGHLAVYVGTNSSSFAQSDSLYNVTSNTRADVSFTFTPASDDTYYIAFHGWSGTTASYIMVDEIRMEGPANNNLTVLPQFPYPYKQIPVSQKSIFAQVKNVGLASQTNVVFSAELNSANVGSSSPISSLAVGATGDFSLTSGIVFNGGANTVVYAVSQAETDDVPADNTVTHTFTGTSIVYATDDVASIAPTSDNTVSFSKTTGNIYKITDPITLTGVAAGFGFHGAYSLTSTIALYRLSGNLTVEETPIFTKQVTRPSAGGIYNFTLDAPVSLTPGDYFLAFEYGGSNIGPAKYSVTPSNYYVKDGNTLTVGAVQNSGLVLRLVLQSEGACTVVPVPAAPAPGNYSAVLSWESDPAYQYKVVLTYGGNSQEYITTNKTITINGLPSGENFTWTVAAMCDLTTTATSVAGAPFTTLPCPEFVSEGFNGTFPPSECWISTSTNNTPWKQVSTGLYPNCNPHEGAGMIQYNAYAGAYNNQRGVLVTPAFTHTDHLALSFWLYRDNGYNNNAEKVNIYLSETTDITGLTPVKTFSRSRTQDPVEAADGWYQYHVTLQGDAGEKYHVAIEGVGANGNNIYLDEIAVGDYVDVADAGVTAVTTPVSGINLGESTVTVKVKNYGTSGLANVPVSYQVNEGAVVTETIDAIPYNGEVTYVFTQKADLSAAETTTFTIKAYTGQSADANLANDTTAISVINTVCSAITTFPWTESFEANNTVAPYIPTPCWSATQTHPTSQTLPTYWNRQTTGGTPTCSPQDGSAMLRFYCYNYQAGSTGVLYTPPLALGTNIAEFSFYIYRHTGTNAYAGPGSTDKVNIYASSTQSLDGATLLTSVHRCSELEPVETTEGWYKYTAIIPAGSGEDVYIAIEGVSQYGYNIYLDNISVSIPLALSTKTPADNATLVLSDAEVSATFTEAITAVDATSLELVTIVKTSDSTPVADVVATIEGSKLNIAHATLDHDTQYSVNIPVGVITGYNEAIPWSFTTIEALIPTPVPADETPDVAIDAEIAIEFNRAAVRVQGSGSNPVITDITDAENPVVVTDQILTGSAWNDTDTKYTLTTNLLGYGKTYKVTLPAGAQIRTADYAQDIEWSFTTIPAATVVLKYPEINATGITIDDVPYIQFSKSIAGSSLADITINDEPITPVLANGGDYGLNSRLRFTHGADYEYGTLYTIKVPAAAIVDYVGGDIELTFTTDVALDYTTTPTGDEVALDAEIAVVFNKNILTWGGFGSRPVVTITATGGTEVTGVDFVDIAPSDDPTNTLVINHDALAYDTEYVVIVPADVVGAYSFIAQGEPITWTFKTLKGTGLGNLSASGKVYVANKKLHISGYPAGSLVAVYNVVGEATTSRRITSDNTIIELTSGVYVVNVQVEGKTYIHKVLVK
jgi:hypothetical protein